MALHKCSCKARYPDDLAKCPQCGKATAKSSPAPKTTQKKSTTSKKKGA